MSNEDYKIAYENVMTANKMLEKELDKFRPFTSAYEMKKEIERLNNIINKLDRETYLGMIENQNNNDYSKGLYTAYKYINDKIKELKGVDKVFKLYELPEYKNTKLYIENQVIIFDHLDGLYSYCWLEEDKTKIAHIKITTLFEKYKDGYKLVGDDD